jgi:hypothetical protein
MAKKMTSTDQKTGTFPSTSGQRNQGELAGVMERFGGSTLACHHPVEIVIQVGLKSMRKWAGSGQCAGNHGGGAQGNDHGRRPTPVQAAPMNQGDG